MSDDYREIAVEDLPVGVVLHFPVFHGERQEILMRGSRITDDLIAMLTERRIAVVRIHASDLARGADPSAPETFETRRRPPTPADPREGAAATPTYPVDDPSLSGFRSFLRTAAARDELRRKQHALCRSTNTRLLDAKIDLQRELIRSPSGPVVQLQPKPIASLADHRRRIQELDDDLERRIPRLEALQERFLSQNRVDIAQMQTLADDAVSELLDHPDAFCTALRPIPYTTYPARHAWMVARLGIAVAGALQWTRNELNGVFIGAFCHDLGMRRINPRILQTRSPLSSAEWLEMTKHPVFSLDLVGAELAAAKEAPFVVYQAHERLDGTGYPRSRLAKHIHPAARLVGLVDAYVAMASQRPYRPPFQPHRVLVHLARETKSGLWDPAIVRGLVGVVSMYPLGSFVQLSDGRIARSIAAIPADPLRPELEAWEDPALAAHEPGEHVRLAVGSSVSILRPIDPPQAM